MRTAPIPHVPMVPVTLNILGDASAEWPGGKLTSNASAPFALVLLLTLDGSEPITRRLLESLLFAEGLSDLEAAHSFRQLLYRVRKLGLDISDARGLLSLENADVADPLDPLRAMSPAQRASLTLAELAVLPGWHPKLPADFLIWLDGKRALFEAEIKRLTAADLAYASEAGDWTTAERSARRLSDMGVPGEEWRITHAEVLYMLGRHAEAVESLDMLLSDATSEEEATAARALRARVLRPVASSAPALLRGRESAIAQLNEQWQQAQSGGARLMAIIGPPGIGKTRLSDEFASVVRMRGGKVMSYRCDPAARPYPLALFAHLLPELRNLRGSIGVSERHLAVLERLRPSGAATNERALEHLSPARIRAELHDALVDLVEAVSEETPLLIVIDDAHLLDRHSVSLLRHLIATTNQAKTLFLACCRSYESTQQLVAPSARSHALILSPLSADDSRALLTDLTKHRGWTSEQFDKCLSQAAGIPFYLYALSQKDRTPDAEGSHAVDVSSLAAATYYSLEEDAKTVLEAVLLLGPLATLDRLGRVAGIDERALMRAFRTLEDRGLVGLQHNVLRGPHALLQDALRALVPGSVEGLLRQRAAAALSFDYRSPHGDDISLAIAAAESLTAIGQSSAAAALLRASATRIASLGEPAIAAEMLSQLATPDLSYEEAADLGKDIIAYAQAGGERAMVTRTLKTLIELARASQQSTQTLRELELRHLEADAEERTVRVANSALHSIAADPTAGAATRQRSIMLSLVNADLNYDREAASNLVTSLKQLADLDGQITRSCELVYQTVFGDVNRARDLAQSLISSYPIPDALPDTLRARRHAAYCFMRLADHNNAIRIAETDFAFHAMRGDRSSALWWATLLCDSSISLGCFDNAKTWLSRADDALRDLPAERLNPASGYSTNAVMLAMLDKDYDRAARLLDESDRNLRLSEEARFRSQTLALRLRLQIMRGDDAFDHSVVRELSHLYERGKALGTQDTIAEMLWCVVLREDGPEAATSFLSQYLTEHRREPYPPEWLLRKTTGVDMAWRLKTHSTKWAG